MTLKINTTDKFVVSLNLNIDYSAERISLRVYAWDKKSQEVRELVFPASEFSAALQYYKSQEEKMEGKYQR